MDGATVDGATAMLEALRSGTLDDMVAPLKVTDEIKQKIASLPLSEDVWYAAVHKDATSDGLLCRSVVFRVTKEHGSNGKRPPDADGIAECLAICARSSQSHDYRQGFHVLLGSIARACLEPISGSQVGSSRGGGQRPRKVLLQSEGNLQFVKGTLKKMGIKKFGVAESAIVSSAESLLESSDITGSPDTSSLMGTDTNGPNDARRATVEMLRSRQAASMNPYVSETRLPLRGWTPPDDSGFVPRSWYARRPSGEDYRLTELWGWRTNLERAVCIADVDKIREIVQRRDKQDVRELCECRILLSTMAEKGVIDACRALLDYCGVSVEGVQAPDAPAHWRIIQRSAGNGDGTTPLHRASAEGYSEIVELLLSRGASITATSDRLRGTALLHALAYGHSGCVRILCQHGSDISYSGALGGEALDVSVMVGMENRTYAAIQRKVREILREYDPRCSHCRAEGAVKQCSCRLERYCNRDCQRARWKEHKKQHNTAVASNT